MSTTLALLKLLLRPTWAAATSQLSDYERFFSKTIVEDESMPAMAFGKGRVALWAILRALGLRQNSQVLLPAYTCETVPMALKYAGVKCLYVDVEPQQFNASIEQYRDAVTSDTRALICQHTYGIVQPIEEFLTLAEEKHAALIEDCCHLVESNFNRKETCMRGHTAFFSTHYSKPFSTGQGGMAVFPDHSLYDDAKTIRDNFPDGNGRIGAISFSLQMLIYTLAVRPATRALMGNIYRRAQRAGFIRGSISTDEYEETMPAQYLAKASNCQAILGIEKLQQWNQNIRHRQMLTRFYIEQLSTLGVEVTALKMGGDDPVLLYVPVLIENKGELLKLAMRKGVPIACWFDRTPAHICPDSAYHYDYRPGQCPWAEELISKEVHLLTAPWVTLRQAEKAIRLIKRYAHLVSY